MPKYTLSKTFKFRNILNRNKNLRPVSIYAALILLILTPVIYLTLRNGEKAAAWYNSSWAYRQSIIITNDGSSLTDYPVSINLDTSTLITNGKMQSDCDDIRVTDQNGTIIPHVLDINTAACNTTTTNIWANVPSIPDSTSVIYVYYGNPSASSTQSGNDVFQEWDLTTFIEVDPASDLTVNSNRQISTSTMSSTVNAYIYKTITSSTTGTINFDINRTSGSSKITCVGISNQVDDCLDATSGAYLVWRWSTGFRGLDTTADTQTSDIATITDGVTYYATIKYSGSNAIFSVYSDPARTTLLGTQSLSYSTAFTHLYAVSSYEDGSAASITDTLWNFHFRPYVSTEPVAALHKSEEVSGMPVAYWKLDEGTGTTVYDTMGFLNGTLGSGSSAPQWKTGGDCLSESCLYFDGSNDHVDLGTTPIIGSNPNFTISGWVKRSRDTVTGMIYAEGSSSDLDPIVNLGWGSGGTIEVVRRDNVATGLVAYSTEILPYDEWQHLTFVNSGTTYYLYLNGTQIKTGTYSAPGTMTMNRVRLGVRTRVTQDATTKGFIDDVKVYRYARTADEIKKDYAIGGIAPGAAVAISPINSDTNFSYGLLGYWKLDEAANNTCSGGANDGCDSSGNGKDVAVTGTGTVIAGKYGNARNFASGTSYMATANDTFTNSMLGEGTLSAWVKSSTANPASTSYFIDNEGYTVIGINTSGKAVGCTDGICNFATSTTSVNDGNWHLVTMTWSGTSYTRIYVDGVLEGSATPSVAPTPDTVTRPFKINGHSANTTQAFASTSLDEIRLYSRPFTDLEVKQLYNFAPGPIAHWKLDENSGTSLSDSSGNSYTSSLGVGSSAPQWASAGKYASALSFDGSNDYASAGDFYDIGSSDFTLSTWVYPTSLTGSKFILVKDQNLDSNSQFRIGTSSGKPYFIISNSTNTDALYTTDYTLMSPTSLNTDEWAHIAVTRRGVNYSIYVNGAVVDTATSAAEISHSNTVPFYFGAQYAATSGYWSGYIDDVKFYNYLRTPSQINQDLNADHPNIGTPVGSTVLHLKMDEGYGTTTYDNSPQANDGTFGASTAAPVWSNSGKMGKGINFDGVNDYIQISDAVEYQFGTGDFSVSAWIYPETVSFGCCDQGTVISKSNTAFEYFVFQGKMNAYVGSGSINGSKTLSVNTWYHVTLTRSGSTVTSYINGQIDATTTDSSDISNIGTNVNVGQRTGSTTMAFDGVLDEVKLYPFALTQEEVNLELNQGKQLTIGALSTDSDGSTPSNSSARAYCVPGDTSTCSAPVGEWLLNESTGGTAYDTSTSGASGSLGVGSSAPSWVTGKYGAGLNFDGVNDDVNLGDALAGVTSILGSVSLWFKTDNPTISSAAMLFYAHNSGSGLEDGFGGGRELHVNLNTSKQVQFFIESFVTGTDLNIISSSAYDDNKWHHVTAVWDQAGSGLGYLYVDGQLVGTGSVSSINSYTLDGNAHLGKMIAGDYRSYEGSLDEVRVYGYARTPAQIAWEYNRGAPIAHYKFDECQGTTINDWAPNSNGGFNGNNGTLSVGATGTQTSAGTCATSGGWYNGATGKKNSSISLDGTDDLVTTVSDINLLDFEDSKDFSYSMWVKPAAISSNQTIIAKKAGTGSASNGYLTYVNSAGKVVTYITDGTDSINKFTDTTLSAGEWAHITVIYRDGVSLTMYINGKDGGGSLSGTIANVGDISNALELIIGAESDSQVFWDGQIDEVKIYNYALSLDQIQVDMSNGAVNFQ